ncbi:MAG TPA: glyceraldehyde 3-phosphate dehydrogenase NAD-binding domain-containing protein [Candidatus Paceibacterota bacterium]|nr:glyceraldehyde 3-phosphate dehydrogenase NAD-binding domain-containing protein [Candidatus Paceibacterota bacterium]
MEKLRIAINGFGRIGRIFFRQAFDNPQLEIVTINDLADIDTLVYLLKYDSVYGQYPKELKIEKTEEGNFLNIEKNRIVFLQQKDPLQLPWKDLKIDVVIESTGAFESFEKAAAHLQAGADRVIITAPAKDDDGSLKKGATIICGINDDLIPQVKMTSNGSCTTNAIAPALAILSESIGIKKAVLNTTHAYTATQKIVDGPDSKDLRRGRAGAINLVPSTTGAAIAVGKVIKELDGIFDGISIRTPVPIVSLADVTFVSQKKTSVEEINQIFTEAAKNPRWEGIFTVVSDPVVSTDLIGNSYPSIADLSFTKVIDGDLVKILIWYDNEWGYAASLIKHAEKILNLKF